MTEDEWNRALDEHIDSMRRARLRAELESLDREDVSDEVLPRSPLTLEDAVAAGLTFEQWAKCESASSAQRQSIERAFRFVS